MRILKLTQVKGKIVKVGKLLSSLQKVLTILFQTINKVMNINNHRAIIFLNNTVIAFIKLFLKEISKDIAMPESIDFLLMPSTS